MNAAITAHEIHLGRLCISWAALDHELDSLFRPLLQCSAEQIAALVGNIDNTAARCEMLRRLIFVEAPSEPWREWFVGLIDRITNELGPMRNRYIHDAWSVFSQPLVRRDRRALVKQAQSRQPPKLVFNTEHVAEPGEVERFTSAVSTVLAAVAFAAIDLRRWRQTGKPLEPEPRLIPASKKHARHLTPREHLEALQKGQSLTDYVFDR